MTQRDWIEKDFYRELGVASGASNDEIKKAYRKLARELHPDANPGDPKAEARFKTVSEAYGVLSDETKRKEYDETRALFAGGGGGVGGAGFPGGFGSGASGQNIDFGDLFGRAGAGGAGQGAGGLGDLFGGLFGAGGRGTTTATPRSRRGADVESELTIDFVDAVRGAEVPIRLSSPGRCEVCGGSGARPGTSPHVCPTCAGSGFVSTSQGAFAFSEPCRDCRGSGRIVDDPCHECGGDGVSTRTRSLTVRVPAGVADGNKVRLKGQGQPGMGGAPAGDLYVTVHVTPHKVFGRSATNPDDLTLTVPVTFPELALGSTLTVPTLDAGTVSLRIPPGTRSGRTLRVRGRGVQKRTATGDLLVTVEVAVPARLSDAATTALQSYVEATKGDDPRADLLGGRR
ncbi:MAG: molecular chaperone DnaJ [Pseudonocardiales bacterium]|nr:molecular chaperone DnaJ [Pseudonocardiales bacterium]